jgi:hypothetical protein
MGDDIKQLTEAVNAKAIADLTFDRSSSSSTRGHRRAPH